MKKLLILFLLISLLTACDNNPFANNDRKKTPRDKNEKNDRGNDDDDEDYTKSNWTKKQRNYWMNKCLDEYSDDPKAKQICSCVLDKMEKKYPDERDAKEVSEDESDIIIESCETRVKEDEYDKGDYIKRTDRTDDDDDYTGSGWTNAQREQYIDQCATAAKQNISSSRARSYCDCMQNKIEKKYRMSFTEANKITPADLSTPEATADIQECLGN